MTEIGEITNIDHSPETRVKSPQEVFRENVATLTSLMNDPEKAALVNQGIGALISEIRGTENTEVVSGNEVISDKEFGEANTQDVPSEINDDVSGESQAQEAEVVADEPVKNEEVGGEPNEVDLQGNLEQETKEAVKIGQELANQVFDFFGIGQVTEGKKIEVDESGIKDFLKRISSPGGLMEDNNDVQQEIQDIRRFVNESSDQSYQKDVSIRHLIKNLEFFVYEMKVDGKELNYWKPMGGERGIPGTISEDGKKISTKIEAATPLRLGTENKKGVSDLVDKYEQFMSSMGRVRQIDNQTGKKIQSRDWKEIYNLQ